MAISPPLHDGSTKAASPTFVARLCRKLGMTTYAQINERCNAWDCAQANDFEVWDAEPDKPGLTEAFELRRTDPKAGFHRLLGLAEQGSVWAMMHVGASFRNGQGVPADLAQSEAWFRRAMEVGCQSALLNCAALLFARHDWAGAEAVYAVGAAQDWAPGFCWQARCMMRRSRSRETAIRARPLYERAAALGSPTARRDLARNMFWGRFGGGERRRGFERSHEVFERLLFEIEAEERSGKPNSGPFSLRDITWTAALRGNAKAQRLIGRRYVEGFHIEIDYALAMTWFRRAAARGDRVAWVWIGHLYLNGLGLAQDYGLALEAFRAGAALGEPGAQAGIGNFYAQGLGLERDYSQALQWFEKASEQGHAVAQVWLGSLYAQGLGTPVDKEKARAWFEKADAQGEEGAQAWLAWIGR